MHPQIHTYIISPGKLCVQVANRFAQVWQMLSSFSYSTVCLQALVTLHGFARGCNDWVADNIALFVSVNLANLLRSSIQKTEQHNDWEQFGRYRREMKAVVTCRVVDIMLDMLLTVATYYCKTCTVNDDQYSSVVKRKFINNCNRNTMLFQRNKNPYK